MAVYFIKSKSKTTTQDGVIYLENNISTLDEYDRVVKKWKHDVAKEVECKIDEVEILTVNLLS